MNKIYDEIERQLRNGEISMNVAKALHQHFFFEEIKKTAVELRAKGE